MRGGQCRRQQVQGVPVRPAVRQGPLGYEPQDRLVPERPTAPVQARGPHRSAVHRLQLGEHRRQARCHQRLPGQVLDVANNAGIPPIQAHYQGYDAKIVAINITRKPNYLFATKPGSDIHTVADFKGKKLAFSQGQAQGVVLLRALKEAGLAYDEVKLVPLTSNQFFTALQSGQVDIAPLANSQAPAYLKQYESKGARAITTDVVDLLNLLWAPTSVLADPAKAAAVAAYIPRWAQGQVWAYEHPDAWNEEFYVKTQNLTLAQARSITELANKPLFPPSWDEAVKWEQETADLLAEGGFVKAFKVGSLFDRRFEGIAAKAVPAEYRK